MFSLRRVSPIIVLFSALGLFALTIDVTLLSASGCTHYASPTGTGTGASSSSPFQIANFWSVAKPGSTLCLLDGQYRGAASMINPPQNLRGTATAPITVTALNDGKVTIDGQGSLTPVRLHYNDYFVLQGFNAKNSVGSVISLSNSNYNVVRRVAAWEAADNNTNIFGVHYGNYNLLEDVAGWGVARKIFSSSQDANYTTIRRAWGRWEGSHVVGPKMTYTLTYNNYNLICENCIGTWSGERMKETYTLLDYYGNPFTGNGAGTYSNYGVDQPYGIFAIDGFSAGKDRNARSKILGSLAYVRGSDRFQPARTVFITKLDSFDVANTVAYVEPGYHTTKRPFALYNLATAVGVNLVAKNLTAIGGTASYFGTDWKTSSISEGSTPSSVGNVFNSTTGANLCYRYNSATLTTQPLWPWPMNQRIIDGMIESSRSAVDVTATIEKMLGTIPSICKASVVVSPPTVTAPTAPTNLLVTR